MVICRFGNGGSRFCDASNCRLDILDVTVLVEVVCSPFNAVPNCLLAVEPSPRQKFESRNSQGKWRMKDLYSNVQLCFFLLIPKM